MSDRHPKSLVGLPYFNFDTYYVGKFKLRVTQHELLRLTYATREGESPYDVLAYGTCGKLIAITLRGGVTLYIKRKKTNILILDIALLIGLYTKGFSLYGYKKAYFGSHSFFMPGSDQSVNNGTTRI